MPETDYDRLARDYDYIGSLLVTANAKADTLHVLIPQSLARTMADILTFPEEIREGRAVAPPLERFDEAGPDQ